MAPNPTTPAAPAGTSSASAVQAQPDQVRLRAHDLHTAADRSAAVRYAERGTARDDAERAARSARSEATTATDQARHERAAVAEARKDIAEFRAEMATADENGARLLRDVIHDREVLAKSATEHAQQLERTARDATARADDLDHQLVELRQVAGDTSVSETLRSAAREHESAATQLERKVHLLTNADELDADAARFEADGDQITADLYREQVTALRAEAGGIEPEIPTVDQRLLDAVDPANIGPTGNDIPGRPLDDDRPRNLDTDGDGLTDVIEAELGTDPINPDTDGDHRPDGFEVGVSWENPRVRGAEDLSDEALQSRLRSVEDWEAKRGLAHNEDTDGDGFAQWVELFGLDEKADLTAADVANNLSPLDQFMKSATDQTGARYQFGAEVDPASVQRGEAFDSSELVEFAAKQAGVRDMPDGSWRQYQYLDNAGAATSVETALKTKGALLFGFSSDPMVSDNRPERAYVAISMGNGKVLEVSERTGEVREVDPGDLYKYAATIPELHRPMGDLDGDGWTDQEELDLGGDISRGVTVPRGATGGPLAPTPENTGIVPLDLRDGVDDPLGAERYTPDAGRPNAPGSPATDPSTGTDDPSDDPTGATGYEPGTGVAPDEDTSYEPGTGDGPGAGWDRGGADGDDPAPAAAGGDADAGAPGDDSGSADSYSDSGSADSYSDSYGDSYDDPPTSSYD